MNSEEISADTVRAACISTSTRRAYSSCIRVISQRIRDTQTRPDSYFEGDGVIDTNVFTPDVFERFLLWRVNAQGKTVKVTTLSGYRSAMKNLYRAKRLPIPQEYDQDMKTYFRG